MMQRNTRTSDLARMAATAQLVTWSCLVLAGCSGLKRGPAVPPDLTDQAVIPGMSPAIRTFDHVLNSAFKEELNRSVQRQHTHRQKTGRPGPAHQDYLAISGGGAKGAFTAGVLNGWTAHGDRPEFKCVTGISTGALIAPFAFLGPDYDATLHRLYTQTDTQDILSKRGFLEALTKDAFANSAPLQQLLRQNLTEEVVQRIAEEHRKGRVLLVLTSDLDARKAVIWNITAMAASEHPDAARLIRDVLVASASIPLAFPPIMFDVQADGRSYQEMHVDGGCMTQAFVYPEALEQASHGSGNAGTAGPRHLYVLLNSRVDAEWAETDRHIPEIANRAISSLLHAQGIGDLYRLYLRAQRHGLAYRLAFIPASFDMEPDEPFDPKYMRALYQVGYEQAAKGRPWNEAPPGLTEQEESKDRSGK